MSPCLRIVTEFPVRVFETFTEDWQAIAQWRKACGVTTVAMEATGVYRTFWKHTELSPA
jgi:hypothetical protein